MRLPGATFLLLADLGVRIFPGVMPPIDGLEDPAAGADGLLCGVTDWAYLDPGGYSHLKDLSPRVNTSRWRSGFAMCRLTFLLFTRVGTADNEVMIT